MKSKPITAKASPLKIKEEKSKNNHFVNFIRD